MTKGLEKSLCDFTGTHSVRTPQVAVVCCESHLVSPEEAQVELGLEPEVALLARLLEHAEATSAPRHEDPQSPHVEPEHVVPEAYARRAREGAEPRQQQPEGNRGGVTHARGTQTGCLGNKAIFTRMPWALTRAVRSPQCRCCVRRGGGVTQHLLSGWGGNNKKRSTLCYV